MNLLSLPWIELAVFIPLIGAICLARIGDPHRGYQWCLAFTGVTLICSMGVWIKQWYGLPEDKFNILNSNFGIIVFEVDKLSAILIALQALIHFLTALATARTKMARFSFGWLLAGESLRLATFGTMIPWLMIALVAATTLPPYFELMRRGKPTRVYVIHMAIFVALLIFGWAFHEQPWAAIPLFAAILIRSGTIPFHVWVTDLFESGAFGSSLLYMATIGGVYLAVRLVLPIAPEWVLQSIGLISLIAAFYCAGMALVQVDARRFFAFHFLSHASLILVGLELHTVVSLTGALALWISVALSLSGLGLTLRALEARLGRLSLTEYQGLYEQSPSLAICFLLTGLASVGFPGALGFVATDLLVEGAVGVNLFVGLFVVLATAINGIAVVRVYFLLFAGKQHTTEVTLGSTLREKFAILTLTALILGGGFAPQALIESRYEAAEAILSKRSIPAEMNE